MQSKHVLTAGTLVQKIVKKMQLTHLVQYIFFDEKYRQQEPVQI